MSITWGAPGTAKSRVLSEMMLCPFNKTDGCMVGNAAANVAVDALLRKVAEGYRSRHPEGDMSIVRIYS